MVEMVVAGAGLAGLAVALFAARDGHEVVVLEADGRAVPDAYLSLGTLYVDAGYHILD